MNTTRQAKAPINADRFNAILAETTPLAAVLGIRAERIGVGVAWSRITFSAAVVRALMALVDMCMYAAVLGTTGEDLRALTTNLSITFLRRPPARDLIARCRLLNRSPEIAVGLIVVYPEGDEDDEAEIVCTSTCTYAFPPD